MPRSAASDLVMRCLQMSYKKDARLKWVKPYQDDHKENTHMSQHMRFCFGIRRNVTTSNEGPCDPALCTYMPEPGRIFRPLALLYVNIGVKRRLCAFAKSTKITCTGCFSHH